MCLLSSKHKIGYKERWLNSIHPIEVAQDLTQEGKMRDGQEISLQHLPHHKKGLGPHNAGLHGKNIPHSHHEKNAAR